MAHRGFNWKFVIVLFLTLGVLGATAYALRQWNRSRRAVESLELGTKMYDEGNWEEAAQHLGRCVGVMPDNIPILMKYAQAQLNIRPVKPGAFQQAVGAYRQVLRVDKNHTEAAEKLIDLYLQNAPSEAEFIAREVLKDQEAAGFRRRLALALLQQRKFPEAAAELTAIIEKYPQEIPAYEMLGQLARQRPQEVTTPAETWYQDAVRNNPDSPYAYMIRASYYRQQQDLDQARADLAQAEKLDLTDPQAKQRLIQEYIALNELEKAKALLTALQAEKANDLEVWVLWAQYARGSGSNEEIARIAREGAESLGSLKWDFLPIAIELLFQADQRESAVPYMEMLREKEMFPAFLAYFDGINASLQNQDYQAIQSWQKALQLGNTSAPLRLQLADTLERVGNLPDALQQLRTLAAEQPDSYLARWRYAQMLTRAGKWSEAAEQVQAAQQLNPAGLDAALLNIQIKMQLLQQSDLKPDDPQWQTLASQMKQLRQAAPDSLPVKLADFQLALLLQQKERAEQIIADLNKSDPDSIQVAMAQISLLEDQGRSEEIEPALRAILQKHPQTLTPVKVLATYLLGQSRTADGQKVIQEARQRIAAPQAQRELGLLLADWYRSQGQNDQAVTELEALSSQFPQDISILRQLLNNSQIRQNDSRCRELVDKIKEREGQSGWQWRYEQARLWLDSKDFSAQYAATVSLLKENLQARPDDNASRILLAAAYDKAGDHQLALATFREAYHRSPRDLNVMVPLVAALNKAGEFAEADEILNRAAQQKFSHPLLSSLRYQNYIGLGRLDSGATILQELLKENPENQPVRLQLALLKMRQEKWQEAELLLQELQAADPQSPPVLAALIELHAKQGHEEAALQFADTLVETQKDASAYLVRAQTYALLQKPQPAEADYRQAVALDPARPEAQMALGRFYQAQGNTGDALKTVENLLAQQPDYLPAVRLAVMLQMGSSDPAQVQQGKTLLEQSLAAHPEDVELRLFRVFSLLSEGTQPAIVAATGILEKITQDHPESADAWRLLGQLALQQGQPGKGIDLVLRGLVSSPTNRNLLLLKAQCEGFRTPALAIPTLNTLRQLYPQDAEIILSLARVHLASGSPEQAAALLEQELAVCPDADRRRLTIALWEARYQQGDREEALQQLDTLYAEQPQDPLPLLTQARLLQKDQKDKELLAKAAQWQDRFPQGAELLLAITNDLQLAAGAENSQTVEQILRLILRKTPDQAAALERLAMLLNSQNRIDESVELYRTILKLAPDNVIAMNNLAWILSENQEKYQEALALAQQGLQLRPDYLDLRDTRGVIYSRLGELEKAVLDFQKCIELYPAQSPGIVGSYLHLGRALAALGQTPEALANLRQALDLNQTNGGLSPEDAAAAEQLVNTLSQGN